MVHPSRGGDGAHVRRIALLIANAPYRATMGLVQKISTTCRRRGLSAFGDRVRRCERQIPARRITAPGSTPRTRRAELTVLFGAIVLVTGPLWARKAWGVWWQWDVRLTSSLMGWMVAWAYLLVRQVRRSRIPTSSPPAWRCLGWRMCHSSYVSVNYWRTIHPATRSCPRSPLNGGCALVRVACFLLLFVLLLRLRVHLEEQRARLDAVYLSLDE